MIDLFIILAPLAVLPIVLYFVFIGCPLEHEATTPPLYRRTIHVQFVNDTTEEVGGIDFHIPITRIPSDLESSNDDLRTAFEPPATFTIRDPGNAGHITENVSDRRNSSSGNIVRRSFTITDADPGFWTVTCTATGVPGPSGWSLNLDSVSFGPQDWPRDTVQREHTLEFILQMDAARVTGVRLDIRSS
jgi:hypothetical protein